MTIEWTSLWLSFGPESEKQIILPFFSNHQIELAAFPLMSPTLKSDVGMRLLVCDEMKSSKSLGLSFPFSTWNIKWWLSIFTSKEKCPISVSMAACPIDACDCFPRSEWKNLFCSSCKSCFRISHCDGTCTSKPSDWTILKSFRFTLATLFCHPVSVQRSLLSVYKAAGRRPKIAHDF